MRENILKYAEAFKMVGHLYGSLAVLFGSLPHYVGRRRSRIHRVRGVRVGVVVWCVFWVRTSAAESGGRWMRLTAHLHTIHYFLAT